MTARMGSVKQIFLEHSLCVWGPAGGCERSRLRNTSFVSLRLTSFVPLRFSNSIGAIRHRHKWPWNMEQRVSVVEKYKMLQGFREGGDRSIQNELVPFPEHLVHSLLRTLFLVDFVSVTCAQVTQRKLLWTSMYGLAIPIPCSHSILWSDILLLTHSFTVWFIYLLHQM